MSSVSTIQLSATLVPDNTSYGGSGPITRSYGDLPRPWLMTIVPTFLSCSLDWSRGILPSPDSSLRHHRFRLKAPQGGRSTSGPFHNGLTLDTCTQASMSLAIAWNGVECVRHRVVLVRLRARPTVSLALDATAHGCNAKPFVICLQ